MRWLTVTVVVMGLLVAGPARAVGAPRYDVPRGFTRCPHALAWHGFFKWASERRTTCHGAARFMRAYAAHARGTRLPHHVGGYDCRIHYWRNEDGDIYASRHVCARRHVTVRFYGMV
jgi:hypothetical protein